MKCTPLKNSVPSPQGGILFWIRYCLQELNLSDGGSEVGVKLLKITILYNTKKKVVCYILKKYDSLSDFHISWQSAGGLLQYFELHPANIPSIRIGIDVIESRWTSFHVSCQKWRVATLVLAPSNRTSSPACVKLLPDNALVVREYLVCLETSHGLSLHQEGVGGSDLLTFAIWQILNKQAKTHAICLVMQTENGRNCNSLCIFTHFSLNQSQRKERVVLLGFISFTEWF